MAQLQHGKQPNGLASPDVARNVQTVNPEKSDQFKHILSELERLSVLIERNILDLTQPMTVILGLSELLRPHINPDSQLATDLATLTKQVERMNQTLKKVNGLVEQKNKLLSMLDAPQLDYPRLRFEHILTLKREEHR